MKKQTNTLREELLAAGASTTEADELAVVANNLRELGATKRAEPKLRGSGRHKWMPLIPIGIMSFTGLVLGLGLAIYAQTVLPGGPLYPIQKLSDNVTVSMNPQYRAQVMMKRAQEVKQLVANHADSGVVLSTLADYKVEANLYKSASTNYAAFEYCKTSLQQAAAIAPAPERLAITNALSSLKDV